VRLSGEVSECKRIVFVIVMKMSPRKGVKHDGVEVEQAFLSERGQK
jgi:hypothetical protein